MPEFSTTTQALLDAVCSNTEPDCDTQHLIAAAFEALADRVVPELEEPDWGAIDHIPADIVVFSYHRQKRSRILAIAAELRGQGQPSSEEPWDR